MQDIIVNKENHVVLEIELDTSGIDHQEAANLSSRGI
jgi:hypothetical protein